MNGTGFIMNDELPDCALHWMAGLVPRNAFFPPSLNMFGTVPDGTDKLIGVVELTLGEPAPSPEVMAVFDLLGFTLAILPERIELFSLVGIEATYDRTP